MSVEEVGAPVPAATVALPESALRIVAGVFDESPEHALRASNTTSVTQARALVYAGNAMRGKTFRDVVIKESELMGIPR